MRSAFTDFSFVVEMRVWVEVSRRDLQTAEDGSANADERYVCDNRQYSLPLCDV